MALLSRIQEILDRNDAEYVIFFPPYLNTKTISDKDKEVIAQIFGEENVFDFSGDNAITRNSDYYYDEIHFRHIIGDFILDSIYGPHAPDTLATPDTTQ